MQVQNRTRLKETATEWYLFPLSGGRRWWMGKISTPNVDCGWCSFTYPLNLRATEESVEFLLCGGPADNK